MTEPATDRTPFADDHEPIIGVKLARLVSVAPRVHFAPCFPRTTSRPYDSVADAVCEAEQQHAAPATDCRCGFHAVASRNELWRLDATRETVVLDVELAGTVVEHEFGWRASRQAVLGLYLPARCMKWGCHGRTAGVAPCRTERFGTEGFLWSLLWPVCEHCGKRQLISLAELAAQLTAEVSIDDSERSYKRRFRSDPPAASATAAPPHVATSAQPSFAANIGTALANPLFPLAAPLPAGQVDPVAVNDACDNGSTSSRALWVWIALLLCALVCAFALAAR